MNNSFFASSCPVLAVAFSKGIPSHILLFMAALSDACSSLSLSLSLLVKGDGASDQRVIMVRYGGVGGAVR